MQAKKLYSVISAMNPGLSCRGVVHKCNYYSRKINTGDYDFSSFTVKTVTGGRRDRTVRAYGAHSAEKVLSAYLSSMIQKRLAVSYPSKTQMMKRFHALMPELLKDGDFTVIRSDFENFYDSVETKAVFEHYILPCRDRFREEDFRLLSEYAACLDRNYPGLLLSNLFCELPLRELERLLLEDDRVLDFYRYVDDILIILKGKVEKEDFLQYMREKISQSFFCGDVRLHERPDKFSCVYLKDLTGDGVTVNFLFRDFNFFRKDGNFAYSVDIDVFRRKMISDRMEAHRESFRKDGNAALQKYRTDLYLERCVFDQETYQSGLSFTEWYPWALYFDLYAMPGLTGETTERFFAENGITEARRKAVHVFRAGNGVIRKDLIRILREIDPAFSPENKSYRELAIALMEICR